MRRIWPVRQEGRNRKVKALARFRARPLSLDQLHQSIQQATGYSGAEPPPADKDKSDEDETAADAAPDLLAPRALTVQRSLALQNGEYVNKAAQAGARAALAANGQRIGKAHLEWLFLSTLSRRPTVEELAAMRKLSAEGKGSRGLEDVLWALLNSAEFNTNH